MPAVDRAILRVGAGTAVGDVPEAVALSEAVVLANELSTDDPGSTSTGAGAGTRREAADGSGIASAWCPRWDSEPTLPGF